MSEPRLTSALCAGCFHGEPPLVARPGTRLCGACYDGLREGLVNLVGLHVDCGEAMLPRGRSFSLPPLRGSRGGGGLPVDERLLAARSCIVDLLVSWSGLVVEERQLTAPEDLEPATLVVLLVRNLDWLAAHPAAVDLTEEVSGLLRRVRAAFSSPGGRVESLGSCVHPGCDAAMSVAVDARRGRGAREIRCAAGHSWQPHQWLALSRRIDGHARRNTRVVEP